VPAVRGRNLGEEQDKVIHLPVAAQLFFLLSVAVFAWQPIDSLWYVGHTAPVDCARVVDTAESRRWYEPTCMSAEQLAREGRPPDDGMSQSTALFWLTFAMMVALTVIVWSAARVLPHTLRRRGLRIPD
jgi:hypothetical protein